MLKLSKTVVVCLYILMSYHSSCYSCTVLKSRHGNVVYAGNNEADWAEHTPMTQVWFVTASPGKFGRVFFGYDDNLPQGGMNEHGVFIDWVNWGEELAWQEDPQKQTADFLLHQRILETCATVDEVLTLYREYNEPLFACCRLMVIDKSGTSAILGFVEGAYTVHQSTVPIDTLGHASEQAHELLATLPRNEGNVVQALQNILGTIRQQGAITTRYTNLHNLTTGDITLFVPNPSLGKNATKSELLVVFYGTSKI